MIYEWVKEWLGWVGDEYGEVKEVVGGGEGVEVSLEWWWFWGEEVFGWVMGLFVGFGFEVVCVKSNYLLGWGGMGGKGF